MFNKSIIGLNGGTLGLLLIFLLVASCESTVGTEERASDQLSEITSERTDLERTTTTTLYAGKDIEVGEIRVKTVGDNDTEGTIFEVTYETEGGWHLKETHLHVADDWKEIPTTKRGNPMPGQFAYSETHERVTEITYKVSGSHLGSEVAVAAHAVVSNDLRREQDSHVKEQTETAWGHGERFVERGSWAMWFNHSLQKEHYK